MTLFWPAWLNSQAASGYVVYHPSSTPEQAEVLADEDSAYCILPGWDVASRMWFDEDKTIAAFRTGKGVAWGDHDERLYRGVAAFYNNAYRAQLVQNWLPALDGVVEKLTAGATVVDVGCGHGLSTVIMVESFPNSRFRGFDTHEGSIEAARENARKAGWTAGCASRWRAPRATPRKGSTSSPFSTASTTWETRWARRGTHGTRWPMTVRCLSSSPLLTTSWRTT